MSEKNKYSVVSLGGTLLVKDCGPQRSRFSVAGRSQEKFGPPGNRALRWVRKAAPVYLEKGPNESGQKGGTL